MASSSLRRRKVSAVDSPYRKRRTKRQAEEDSMTTEEYLATEETLLPSELAYGVLRVADSPSASHQRMVARLHLAMAPVVEHQRSGEILLAPMDVILEYDRALVVQPDLMFISSARAAIVQDKVHGAPDLVVEILSPHPRIGKLNERVEWFARYGVRECWLADLPKEQYAILMLEHGGIVGRRLCRPGDLAPSDVLPGVVLPPIAALPYC
jgi:Uma2 family endonuclease